MGKTTDRIKIKATSTDGQVVFVVMESSYYAEAGHHYKYTHYYVFAECIDHWKETIWFPTINRNKAVQKMREYLGEQAIKGFEFEVLKGDDK